MSRYIPGSATALLLIIAFSLSSEGIFAKSPSEVNFTIAIRAYDTTIPEATIEGVSIKNVRQFNVLNEPENLVARVGTLVNLKIVNESPISENFSIEGYEVDTTLKAKESTTVRFKANKPGSYTIWCKLHPKNVHLPGTFSVLP